MASIGARRRAGIDIWPGFVDALAAILMVFIFMLLIFVVAQFFLSDRLAGREGALDQLSRGIHELLETLSVEQDKSAQLTARVRALEGQLGTTQKERAALAEQLGLMTQRADESRARARELDAELRSTEATLNAQREELQYRLREIASLHQDVDALRKLREELETQVAALADRLEERERALAGARARSATLSGKVGELESALAERDRELGALRDRSKALASRLADEAERTRLAQVALERRDIRLAELTRQVEQQREETAGARELTQAARAEVALLNEQIVALREQLVSVSNALELKTAEADSYKVEIATLGQRLNQALVRKVRELDRFRSDFFGRLREVLGDNPDIKIVGDRFLLESEVLFPSAQAELQPAGRAQLDRVANTLKSVAEEIPEDVDWILRIDGHTDRQPISTPEFPSNWELSTARALSIVNYLVARGIPPHRLAAAGFGEFRPIDPRDTPQAYARNRRIELKLTGP